jgi:hypothetical protein
MSDLPKSARVVFEAHAQSALARFAKIVKQDGVKME